MPIENTAEFKEYAAAVYQYRSAWMHAHLAMQNEPRGSMDPYAVARELAEAEIEVERCKIVLRRMERER